MKFFTFIALTLITKMVLAESFLPENNLHLEVNFDKSNKGINEIEFNEAIDKVEKVFGPIIRATGTTLMVNKYYASEVVNAYATKGEQFDKTTLRTVSFYGGLAKYKSITPDAFTLVVCHEYGHHLGGAPTYGASSALSWAAAEGQADYWAATKCVKRIWDQEDNEEALAGMKIPMSVVGECTEEYSLPHDQDLCMRLSMAGKGLTTLFAHTSKAAKVDFHKPIEKEVEKTVLTHPEAQCRLDTFFSASLCNKPFSEDASFDSEVTGFCHEENGDKIGLRPRCWFKPRVKP
jgi:hypothetical protein